MLIFIENLKKIRFFKATSYKILKIKKYLFSKIFNRLYLKFAIKVNLFLICFCGIFTIHTKSFAVIFTKDEVCSRLLNQGYQGSYDCLEATHISNQTYNVTISCSGQKSFYTSYRISMYFDYFNDTPAAFFSKFPPCLSYCSPSSIGTLGENNYDSQLTDLGYYYKVFAGVISINKYQYNKYPTVAFWYDGDIMKLSHGIQFQCESGYYYDYNNGYSVTTQPTIWCMENGVFQSERKCTRGCNITSVPSNYNVTYSSEDQYSGNLKEISESKSQKILLAGRSLKALCNGDKRTLDNETSFIFSCDSSGTLSGLKKCDVKGCNLSASYYSPTSIDFRHLESKAVACATNYFTDSGGTSFTASCNNGSISGAQTCKLGCVVNNSYYNPNQTVIPSGQGKYINCSDGYLTSGLSSNFYASCSGTTTSGLQECKRRCVATNMFYQGTTITLVEGQSKTVNCISGYGIDYTTDSFTVSCSNGTMSGLKTCRAKCSFADLRSKIAVLDPGSVSRIVEVNVPIPDTKSYALENDKFTVQCVTDFGTLFDTYTPVCMSTQKFSEVRSCSGGTMTCLNKKGEVGENLKVYASKTPTKVLKDAETYQVTCNDGYFENIFGSKNKSFSFTCQDGKFTQKSSCMKKCQLQDLSYLGNFSIIPLFDTPKTSLTTSDILEPSQEVNITCTPQNGYRYANIDTATLIAKLETKFSCNTSGILISPTKISNCQKIDCTNSEITITQDGNLTLPPEFKTIVMSSRI